MKYLASIIIIFSVNILFSQNDRFIGLIDGFLIEINPNDPDYQIISEVDFPDSSNEKGIDIAYSSNTCLFYTFIDRNSNPKLISFDFEGTTNIIGELTLTNQEISVAEAIAFNTVNNRLYISASLNGQDFFSESLLYVDENTAECTFVTQVDYSSPSPDIDNMTFEGNTLYFNDGNPGPSYTDFFSFDLDDIVPNIILEPYARLPYRASSDLIFYDNSLYYPGQDLNIYSHDFNDPQETNEGSTHSSLEFQGDRILGFEWIDGYQKSDFSTIGIDQEIIAEICSGESYEIQGQSYSAEGTYTLNTTNNSPCFGLSILQLTVNKNSTSQLSANICSGDELVFNGDIFNNPGNYTQVLENSDKNGCDSIIMLKIIRSNGCNLCEKTSIGEFFDIKMIKHPKNKVLISSNDIVYEFELNEELDISKFANIFSKSSAINILLKKSLRDNEQIRSELINILSSENQKNITSWQKEDLVIQWHQLHDGSVIEIRIKL